MSQLRPARPVRVLTIMLVSEYCPAPHAPYFPGSNSYPLDFLQIHLIPAAIIEARGA